MRSRIIVHSTVSKADIKSDARSLSWKCGWKPLISLKFWHQRMFNGFFAPRYSHENYRLNSVKLKIMNLGTLTAVGCYLTSKLLSTESQKIQKNIIMWWAGLCKSILTSFFEMHILYLITVAKIYISEIRTSFKFLSRKLLPAHWLFHIYFLCFDIWW